MTLLEQPKGLSPVRVSSFGFTVKPKELVSFFSNLFLGPQEPHSRQFRQMKPGNSLLPPTVSILTPCLKCEVASGPDRNHMDRKTTHSQLEIHCFKKGARLVSRQLVRLNPSGSSLVVSASVRQSGWETSLARSFCSGNSPCTPGCALKAPQTAMQSDAEPWATQACQTTRPPRSMRSLSIRSRTRPGEWKALAEADVCELSASGVHCLFPFVGLLCLAPPNLNQGYNEVFGGGGLWWPVFVGQFVTFPPVGCASK